MNTRLVLVFATVFLLASLTEVECRRTYSSRSSSSGRGNRGKNQPSSGGIFSSWFGGSKSSSSSSGSISKPAPSSAKKNWQTASSATSQSKPSSGWANPYYKPTGSAQVPSAPKQPTYGWKPANTNPTGSHPSSNIGSRGYPVQSGVQQSSSLGGYKPASNVHSSYQPSQTGVGGYRPASGVSQTNYQPSQTGVGGYRPASVPNTHSTGYHPPGQPSSYGGYGSNVHHSQPGHSYQPSYHQPSYHQPSYHPPPSGGYSSYPHQPSSYSGHYSGYSPQSSFGGAVPSYQGSKLFGGSSGHYGYPGSGSWGIDTYGARKSSGTGKLLTGLAVGAAGGYLTSSLVNRISNPWKYSGYGYGYGSGLGYGGLGLGYGSIYDSSRARDESAFERGFERGVQSRERNENNNNKEAAAAPAPEDPTSKWIQCVAFDPQTQQTLINPNCSCTVTTSADERTGQPISVHHCTTLNGLVMKPIPIQPSGGVGLPPPAPVEGQSFGGVNSPPVGGQSYGGADAPASVNSQSFSGVNAPPTDNGNVVTYGGIYQGDFKYTGGPTVYLPPLNEPKLDRMTSEPKLEQTPQESVSDKVVVTERKAEGSSTEGRMEESTTGSSPEGSTGSVPTSEKITTSGGTPPVSEKLGGGLQENRKRTAEFYGQLQKIVNMGNFVDGG